MNLVNKLYSYHYLVYVLRQFKELYSSTKTHLVKQLLSKNIPDKCNFTSKYYCVRAAKIGDSYFLLHTTLDAYSAIFYLQNIVKFFI